MENSTSSYEMSFTTNATSQQQQQSSSAQSAFEILLIVAVVVGMFGVGCGVEVQKLWKHYKKPTGVLIGICSQFVIMPIISLILVLILQMDSVRSLVLLIIGSCPGGTISNVVVVWVDGDVDLSVAMTIASSLLAFGVMPLILLIYSTAFNSSLQVPFQSIGINLAMVLAPISFGMLLRWKFPKAAKILIKVFSALLLLCSIAYAILALVTYSGSFVLVTGQYISAAIIPLIGMTLGYGLSSLIGLYEPLRLKHYQRRTIAIETGIQNIQVASGIIVLSNFKPQDLAATLLHPFTYMISQLIWLSIMIAAYKIYQSTQLEEEQLPTEYENKISPIEPERITYTNPMFTKNETPQQEKATNIY